MSDRWFTLAIERRIGVSVTGSPQSKRIVFFCHPTPGAGTFDPEPTITSQYDLRLFGIDRPGYDGSDPLPSGEFPTVERFADDIKEFFDFTQATAKEVSDLDFGSIGIVGWSFGSATALSLASRFPSLVDAVVIIGAPAPKRMRVGERYSSITELRKHGVERSVESMANSLADDGPPGFAQLGVGWADPALGRLGTRSRVQHMLEHAITRGSIGIATDRIAVRDDSWVSRLGEVTAPTLILRGEQDEVATEKDAAWYARRLPHSTVQTVPGAGRLGIVDGWARALDHVADRAEHS
jgi:pimeloyl-ACP methyl ester carboxylesterase